MRKRKVLTAIIAFGIVAASTLTSYAGQWKQDSTGWWYENEDGTYLKDTMQVIDGETYSFDTDGYIDTGWHQKKDGWYLFNESGVMQKSKELEGGHLDGNGKLIFDEAGYIDERGKSAADYPDFAGKLRYLVLADFEVKDGSVNPVRDIIKEYYGSVERTQLAKDLGGQIIGSKGHECKKYELNVQLLENWQEVYPMPFIVQIAEAVFTDRWATIGNDYFIFERAEIDANNILHINVEHVMGEEMEDIYATDPEF